MSRDRNHPVRNRVQIVNNFIYNKWAVLGLIVIISGVVYLNSLGNGFHFDDVHHIVNNPHIRSIGNIPLFFVDINTFSTFLDHYRPLVLVSHAVNYHFGRLNPAGYHLVNLAFHIGTAFLLYLIVRSMLSRTIIPQTPHQKGGKEDEGHQAGFIALSAALIFAVHPFNSEAVNYITARSSVMAAFFYLLAFYCWIRYRDVAAGFSLRFPAVTAGFSLRATSYYLASLLAFAAGLLTKEIVITLPVILWLYDLCFVFVSSGEKKAPAKESLFKKYIKGLPLYLPYIFFVAIPYLFLILYFRVSVSSPQGSFKGYFFYLLMETKVLVKFLYLLFFPVNLSVEHAILEVTSLLDWKVIVSMVLLTGVIGIGLYLFRRREVEWRVVSFFILWFFITMLPTTLIPLNAPLQENRGYLAGAGFSIFLGIVVNRFAWRSNYSAILKGAVLILLLFLYSFETMERNSIWKDDVSLWMDAVQKAPAAPRAHYNLGITYEKLDLNGRALAEYRKAIALKADYYQAMNRIGGLFSKKGRTDLALRVFRKAVSIEPTDIQSRMNLARAYLESGQMGPAARECENVLRLGELFNKEDQFTEEARNFLSWYKTQKPANIISPGSDLK